MKLQAVPRLSSGDYCSCEPDKARQILLDDLGDGSDAGINKRSATAASCIYSNATGAAQPCRRQCGAGSSALAWKRTMGKTEIKLLISRLKRHGGNKTRAVHLYGKMPARKGDARQASGCQDHSCCCWEASLRRAMRASAAAAICSLFLLASCSDLDSAGGLLAFPCLLLQH